MSIAKKGSGIDLGVEIQLIMQNGLTGPNSDSVLRSDPMQCNKNNGMAI